MHACMGLIKLEAHQEISRLILETSVISISIACHANYPLPNKEQHCKFQNLPEATAYYLIGLNLSTQEVKFGEAQEGQKKCSGVRLVKPPAYSNQVTSLELWLCMSLIGT